MTKIGTTIEQRKWIAFAHRRMRLIRDCIREEMPDCAAWPVWVHGNQVGFPGDDSAAPIKPAANDSSFIFRS